MASTTIHPDPHSHQPTPNPIDTPGRARTVSRSLSRGVIAILGLALTLTMLSTAPAQARIKDPLPRYQPQVSCDPAAKPGVRAARNLLRWKFGGGDLGIGRACHVGGQSEHKEGRAFDWAWNAHNPRDRKRVARAMRWLTATVNGDVAKKARQLGIMYIIWDRQIWRAYRPEAGWQPYTGASPHTDHVHLSFSWNGATMRTAFWRKGVAQPFDYGPCRYWAYTKYAPKWRAPRVTPCPPPLRRPYAGPKGYYAAQHGETVNRVARFFKVRPIQIRFWNRFPLEGPVWLKEGQRIKVTPGRVPPKVPAPQRRR